jgi:ribosomal protein L11 methyltransferase
MPIYRRVVETTPAQLEETLAVCYAAGAFSIEEQDLPGARVRLLVYFHEAVEGASEVGDSVDWQSVSEQPWVAVEIGDRLWLAPPWLDEEPPAGRRRLNYVRGQACGTGGHAATQLCLRAMDRYLKPGMDFLDVGAGSGILCTAADVLEAGRITGCDIDHYSMTVAAPNCAAPLFTGSLRSVRAASFDFIAANVNDTVLGYLAPELARAARPGGWIVGSGFKAEEEPKLPFEAVDRLEQDGWRAVVYRTPGSPA